MLRLEGDTKAITSVLFQWAPTLGGECYPTGHEVGHVDDWCFNGHPPLGVNATVLSDATGANAICGFNGHPPLGVNATGRITTPWGGAWKSFNGHPPLGVNATSSGYAPFPKHSVPFQWAPTLGGECYGIVYLITPPLCQGGNALLNNSTRF